MSIKNNNNKLCKSIVDTIGKNCQYIRRNTDKKLCFFNGGFANFYSGYPQKSHLGLASARCEYESDSFIVSAYADDKQVLKFTSDALVQAMVLKIDSRTEGTLQIYQQSNNNLKYILEYAGGTITLKTEQGNVEKTISNILQHMSANVYLCVQLCYSQSYPQGNKYRLIISAAYSKTISDTSLTISNLFDQEYTSWSGYICKPMYHVSNQQCTTYTISSSYDEGAMQDFIQLD